ncbi:hypothetical protein AVEN_86104-1 [Araneus ventricosus]|uniref:Uncharacterized protein n=1 Tax=Araneus ventricosus TaxID=182803 RepID=A0A4Y2KG00_ARAVE|nr:hypothetical protein AVEN_86104-1 [Araneus ventricosus]
MKTVTVEEGNTPDKNSTKKKKVAKRHLDCLCFESEDSIHSFEFPQDDTDDNLDTYDLDNEECIICSEQLKTKLGFHCFKCTLWAHSTCTGWDKIQAHGVLFL